MPDTLPGLIRHSTPRVDAVAAIWDVKGIQRERPQKGVKQWTFQRRQQTKSESTARPRLKGTRPGSFPRSAPTPRIPLKELTS